MPIYPKPESDTGSAEKERGGNHHEYRNCFFVDGRYRGHGFPECPGADRQIGDVHNAEEESFKTHGSAFRRREPRMDQNGRKRKSLLITGSRQRKKSVNHIGKGINRMQYRHEIKHEINRMDILVLRQRLAAVMRPDPHAVNGMYEIRSLYFDNADDKALREKVNGAAVREKYRIRIYNRQDSVIHLERKFKNGNLGYKDSAALTLNETRAILRGDTDWMGKSSDEVILGFYTRIRNQGLRPKVLVDYIREPFIFPAGNVRVTLDHDIRTALSCTDLLDPDCVTIPAKESPAVLEVKWDNYLPEIIRDIVQIGSRQGFAYSKYAACRMYA